ncbi:MAG: hypothetical protein ACOX9C_01310 [Kiritimatiellia bacterium]|jgi:hypothetical protein
MRPISALVLAAFWISGFAETAIGAPGGLVGAWLLGAGAALLPGLLDAIAAPVVFRPDVTVAVDPLAPAARPLAAAAKAALRQAASTGAPVRLLVARTPGFDLRIQINAVRRRAFAEIRCAKTQEIVSASQAALPPFTCGDETACIEAADAGDNARVVGRPAAAGRTRLRVTPHRLDARPAMIAELALLAIASATGGWFLAIGAVALPGGCALAARFLGTSRKQGPHPLLWTPGAIALHLAAIAAILANLTRLAV